MAEEKNFEMRVKRLLKDRGAWVLKTWSGGYQRAGVPDLLVCYKGRFIGIELKAERGRVSSLQQVELKHIRDSGGIGIILRPSHLLDFENLLDSIDKGVDE